MDLNEKYCSQANISCVILTYSLALALELLLGEVKRVLLESLLSTLVYSSRVIGTWECYVPLYK